MSKSYGNAISLSMTAEETAKLIKKSKTDSERHITFDPESRPGVSALLTTAALCTGRDERGDRGRDRHGWLGPAQEVRDPGVNDYFAPIRERRHQYEDDLDYVKDVLHDGNARANEVARQTLDEVREAMGMVY
jgi:tryptophanyl-tRNA synthetase